MKRLILLITILTLMCVAPMEVNASNTLKTRYTTQTVSLKAEGKVKSGTVEKVKRNTKLIVVGGNKKWARVEYKGIQVFVKRKYLSIKKSPKKYKGSYFKNRGVIYWNNCKWNWYTQRILPDKNNYLGIKGKHLDKQGFVCDKAGYICLASCKSNRGKIVPTPFGKFGKCYDVGGGGSKWFDVYTNW